MAEGPLCTARSVVLIPERKRVETKAQYAVTCVAQAALSAASGPFRIYTGIRGGGIPLYISESKAARLYKQESHTRSALFIIYDKTHRCGRQEGGSWEIKVKTVNCSE